MGFTDTIMAGQVSAVDMAAVAIGTSLWFPVILFVLGLLLPITPVISHHFGAKKLKNKPSPSKTGQSSDSPSKHSSVDASVIDDNAW